ncbi:unnamed protein product [Durusdinium trenchii]|uniref:Band 7 domain-containing protein n=1 Tax=Durusdinium trenchii TaxID=1381693 RepID=A0ABP0HIX2_9DINO
MEFSIKGVEKAIRVDEETAVIVSSRRAGADQWRLVTEKGPFIPSEDDDEVLESKIIKVDPHHVYIVTTRDGTKKFINGGNNGTAFFLQPYEQINTMRWSSGTSQKDLAEGKINNAAKPTFLVEVSCIDTRWQDAQFMFAVQTSDNVKLNLEGHIFWQIQDVPKMFANTNDPKGDVWKNTRRVLNEVVSKVTLAEFMESFNDLVKNATTADAEFYGLRGTRVHRVEVTGYTCADKRTEQTLQEVNQETTNKINRIRKQESENEVEQAKMEALIHLEQQRSKLIEAQAENERRKASFEGAAKGVQLAEQVKSFMSMLNDSLPETSDRLLLLKLFEQNKAMVENSGKLAGGNATLFVTPEDMQDPLLLKFLSMSAEHDMRLEVAAEYLLQHPQGPTMQIPLLAARHGYPEVLQAYVAMTRSDQQERASQFLADGDIPQAVLALACARQDDQAVQVATDALTTLFQRPGGWTLAEARQLLEPLESLPIQDLGVKETC